MFFLCPLIVRCDKEVDLPTKVEQSIVSVDRCNEAEIYNGECLRTSKSKIYEMFIKITITA